MHATLSLLGTSDFPRIRRGKLETLQVNVGYRCNQQCVHCHVNAGPKRTEEMTLETVRQVLAYLEASAISCLDITGGAPELNPNFRYLVRSARELDLQVIDRCNLTILEESGQEDLGEFLAENRVEITASLPCYLGENVDRQRGPGVFDSSIRALHSLNRLGYGKPGSGLKLNLVYNPQGPTLPPPQADLEAAYRKHLAEGHGIVFDRLFTLANMPIQRFGSMLISKGQFQPYMRLLKQSYRSDNLDNVMCRSILSVDWQGYVYDCDFNQMLGLPLRHNGTPRVRLSDLIGVDIEGNPIVVRDHCYGCTAGQGSSCGGALAR
jgi:radical SAM/Cys-rich protein